jgi:hypothetical protein
MLPQVLTQMEANRVVPDEEMGELLQSIFSIHSSPYKKYMRMCYWLTKFKNMSPWPLPLEVLRPVFKQRVPELHIRNYKKLGCFLCGNFLNIL